MSNQDSLHISIRNKLQLNSHSHAGGQALQRTDGGVGISAFQLADIALRNPGFFGQLFLGHAGLKARVNQRLDDGPFRLKIIVFFFDLRILQLFFQKTIKLYARFVSLLLLR